MKTLNIKPCEKLTNNCKPIYLMKCNNCKSEINLFSATNCTTCGEFIGYPNVLEVDVNEETSALEKRYTDAFQRSKSKGSEKVLKNFEDKIKKASAVINVNLDFLYSFVKSDKDLYATYYLLTRAEVRKPSDVTNDRQRRVTDSLLFGPYAEKIRFAALSLDGKGVSSYGAFALRLRDVTIEKRTVVLEENSWDFIKNHNIRPGVKITCGYRAIWNKKHLLTIAKLANSIKSNTKEEEFAKILLSSEGNYKSDNFIEVHIFGGFDNNAIESVCGSSKLRSKVDKAMLEVVKEHLRKSGKTWIEV